jgi:serine/threonine protein kinase
MGVVYKARHIVLDSSLAVKVLLRPQDSTAQRRFLQEAKVASAIRHPHTVYISDFGVLSDGRSYLVMEFLQGVTLAKLLRNGRLEPVRACKIALQIAQGLHAVHARGIVHRDFRSAVSVEVSGGWSLWGTSEERKPILNHQAGTGAPRHPLRPIIRHPSALSGRPIWCDGAR